MGHLQPTAVDATMNGKKDNVTVLELAAHENRQLLGPS